MLAYQYKCILQKCYYRSSLILFIIKLALFYQKKSAKHDKHPALNRIAKIIKLNRKNI